MSTWNYMKNGVQHGPISTEELRGLLLSGALARDTMVWKPGLPKWEPAYAHAELAADIPPPFPEGNPPPLPPPLRATPFAASTPEAVAPEAADVERNKVFAVISYLPPFLFLVALIAARQSRFAMYHCNQAIVLLLAAIVCGIINTVLGWILVFIPILGWMLLAAIHFILFFGVITLAIIGIMNAAKGVCKPLPFIGHRLTLVQ